MFVPDDRFSRVAGMGATGGGPAGTSGSRCGFPGADLILFIRHVLVA
jgi:hypothetical protein